MVDEQITPNFWLSEFLQSDTAVRKGLDNTPGVAALANIRNLLMPGMQSVRDCLGQPVFITSGFRSLEVNRAVGGVDSSQHTMGMAADFKCPALGPPKRVCEYLLQHLGASRFDQLINESGEWVHASFSARPRGQVLTAHFGAGRTTYTPGLS